MPSNEIRILRFTGPDAADFLQGQLSQDVSRLPEASGLLAAWCNAKGRVIALGRLIDMGGSIGLALPEDLAEAVMRRIVMYRLRAKFEVEIADDWRSLAVRGDKALQELLKSGFSTTGQFHATDQIDGITAVVIRQSDPVLELYGPENLLQLKGIDAVDVLSTDDWDRARIEAGIPIITEQCSELFTPHMLNLDLLDGISFSKGCYPGQEIVARTRYLGATRRRLQRFNLVTSLSGKPGDELSLGENYKARLVTGKNLDVLAVAATDQLPDARLASRQDMAYPLP